MGDSLQIVELDVDNQPVVVADLNSLTADRGYYLERDTLQITPGPRQGRFTQLSGRYGGQRQVGEARDNATFAATFAVKAAAYGTVESDTLMGDAEALAGYLDTPANTDRPRWLMFRPEFASLRRRTLYRLQAAGDWRPRYIRNAFTGGNVMALEFTAPIAPKAFGLPLDNFDSFNVIGRFEDQWTRYGGVTAVSAGGGELFMAGGDAANRVIMLQDQRGEPAGDREILIGFVWDGGTDATQNGLGVILKGTDADNHVGFYLRNRAPATADPLFGVSRVAAAALNPALTTLASGAIVDLPTNTKCWLRARLNGDAYAVELFNQAAKPGDNTAPTASWVGTLTANFNATVSNAYGADTVGFGGVIFEKATSTNWKITDYYDRPYTFRSLLSTDKSIAYRVPGTLDADTELEVYHRSGNRPKFALFAWKRKGSLVNETPNAFGVIDGGAFSGGDGFGAETGLGATYLGGGAYRFDLSAAGASGLRVFYDGRFDAYAADAFAGPTIPVAVWARVSLPSTIVTPRFAAWGESSSGVAASRNYAVDTGIAGKSVLPPSAGTQLRFFPVGVVLVDTKQAVVNRIGVDLSYGPGSSGILRYDYLLFAPARQMASSPVGKDASTYPDFWTTAGQTRRITADLSGRFRGAGEADTLLRPGAGLGGARLELAPGRNDFLFKASDLIPDDPVAAATSEELGPMFDVRLMVTPSYRLFAEA